MSSYLYIHLLTCLSISIIYPFLFAIDAAVKDMEGAAVAWVAQTASLPFLGVKCVTDIVDGDRVTQEEFLENLSCAAKALREAVPKVVEYLLGKREGDV